MIEIGTLALAAACLAFACDGPPPPDDPWSGWDGGFEVEPPAAPALPALAPCREGWREVPAAGEDQVATCEPWPEGGPAELPRMIPCAEGWREVVSEVDGAIVCDPWPEGGQESCDEDQAHFPGEPGCGPVGSACPAGDWAEDLPDDREVLYVLAGAPPGGEGSRESPFGSIAAATAAASSGTVIALSKGTFDEAVTLRRRVTLWGACAAETRLTCSAPSEREATVNVSGQDAAARNLTVSGDRPGVLVFGWSLSVTLTGVVIEGVRGFGVGAGSGARATLRDVVLRDLRPRSSDGQLGRGFQIESEARVELARGVIERSAELGAYVTGLGTELILSDAAIRDTARSPNPESGSAVVATGGARVEVERGVVERNHWRALVASGSGTEVCLSDTVVRDTAVEDDGVAGYGLFVVGGAEAEVLRGTFTRNRGGGIIAEGEGSTVSLADVVVRDTERTDLADLGQRMGRGLWAVAGAEVDLVRGLFERNHEIGVGATSAGTVVRLTDVVVRDTRSRDIDGNGGVGAAADYAASLEIERGVFERNRYAGLMASLPETALEARDVVVRGTRSSGADIRGCGVLAERGAQVELDGAALEDNQSVGLYVIQQDTTLTATDLVVRGTVSSDEGGYGRGIGVEAGARATIGRALVEGNREIGVLVGEDGAWASFTDLVVRGTELDRDGLLGRGIEVVGQAEAVIVRALVAGNRECGISVGREGASASLTDVVVRDTSANGFGEFGRGVVVQEGARLDIERGRLEGNREISLFGGSPGTAIRATDVVVARTLERACAGEGCAEFPAGIGVGIYGGAWLELGRFVISGNPLCGLQLAHGTDDRHQPFEQGGVADLSHGEISDNRIGVNVQTEGFDINRLLDAVLCHDNEVNLDTAELPVPSILGLM